MVTTDRPSEVTQRMSTLHLWLSPIVPNIPQLRSDFYIRRFAYVLTLTTKKCVKDIRSNISKIKAHLSTFRSSVRGRDFANEEKGYHTLIKISHHLTVRHDVRGLLRWFRMLSSVEMFWMQSCCYQKTWWLFSVSMLECVAAAMICKLTSELCRQCYGNSFW